ncbi:hypothetical protein PsorP6_010167 [Peronosclerospora sorghi]|uniref:Uncharacterized protein n=1 Tax=Peronosclerospora sorghi TaxID=230839 RepID=A0ACC0VY31_9STRA|nr:hypothetical protein PsorP6_010167 [Peronosclerospora sorghi]
MTGPQRDKKWRQSWQNAAPRVELSHPTDAVFEKAEAALLDEGRDDCDKRCAALAGVPQQVSPELCLPMWIPARDLTATFSDTEIMTSLGSTAQSPMWTKSLEHLRDFKTIRNAGISFQCTDRDICMKLGGETVSICGRKFKIQPYSKYSHWYYVDLQRLPDDATDGIIYDWFVEHGTRPVYVTPARIIGGLRSRSRRVYFNQKTPPASVMVDQRTPLRQIQFTGQGFTVVHHRISAYNQHVPPFIQEIKEKQNAAKEKQNAAKGKQNAAKDKQNAAKKSSLKQATPSSAPLAKDQEGNITPAEDAHSDVSENAVMAASDSEDNTGSIPPAYDDRSDTSDNAEMITHDSDDKEGSIPPAYDDRSDTSDDAVMVAESASDSEPHSGDQSESDSSLTNNDEKNGDDSCQDDDEPNFPVDPIHSGDFAPARIRRAKRMVFGAIADPKVYLQPLPPSQKEYPIIASVNSFENGWDYPPDQDIILWDKSCTPSRSVGSYVELNPVSERLLNSKVYQGNVEKLSLKKLCSEIEQFLGSFDSSTDADNVMSSIQAQPSLHRALLDSASEENFQHLRHLAFGHAVLRVASTRSYSAEDDWTLSSRLKSLFPGQQQYDYQSVLSQLCPDKDLFWLQVRLAELDLALQIIAPSIYMDPLKLGAIMGKAASALPHPLWLLWDDSTTSKDGLHIQPHLSPLASNVQWALRGYSLNANGFNNVTQRTMNYFSNNFHIVGLQETRFTGLKSFKRAQHLWKKASQLNSSFWSQNNMTSYTARSGWKPLCWTKTEMTAVNAVPPLLWGTSTGIAKIVPPNVDPTSGINGYLFRNGKL